LNNEQQISDNRASARAIRLSELSVPMFSAARSTV
jgi:hypothetical protein